MAKAKDSNSTRRTISFVIENEYIDLPQKKFNKEINEFGISLSQILRKIIIENLNE